MMKQKQRNKEKGCLNPEILCATFDLQESLNIRVKI